MLLTNYLRMAGRHLLRRKTFSLINIVGLSTGIAACILIYGYVHHQQSFDDYHPKADRIARVSVTFIAPGSELVFATGMNPLAEVLLREAPLVESAVRIEPEAPNVTLGTEMFREEHFVYSEQSIFSIFEFAFVEGDPSHALTEPNSIVLSRSKARKYFGEGSALGKTLICEKNTYHVTAVIADRPSNSDIRMDALMWRDFHAQAWMADDFAAYTFVLFRGQADLKGLQRHLDRISAKVVQPELDKLGTGQYHVTFQSEMLANVHFTKGKLVDTPKGSRLFNTIFTVLALFILLVALLNYVNLSTARAEERAREVAVRKVAGARPLQLMGQFLGESFFLMTIAWLLGLAIALGITPFFERAFDTHISFGDPATLLLWCLLFPVSALLAGAWPAFVLSGFQPIVVLKGSATGIKGIGLRKVLTVAQFVIALSMLTGTVVIYQQMRFMMNRDLGADRSQVMDIPIPRDPGSRQQAQAFTRALQQMPEVRGVSVGSGIPVEGVAMGTVQLYTAAGAEKEVMCNFFYIDPRFLPLMKIPLAEGRNLSDSFATDKGQALLVNEAFVRMMGWPSGVGQKIKSYGPNARIVGVVKDFFYRSLHNTIEPTIMIYDSTSMNQVLAKVSPASVPRLKALWKEYFPSDMFYFEWLDEAFNAQYKDDRKTMTLFNGFTVLAVLISCLGLYGLVSLITLRRTREVGIRKVLGASPSGLVMLLTKEFFWLIGLAALLAFPLAAWGLHKWLSSYAYHTGLTVLMFVVPLVGLALVTFCVTGVKVFRTVLENPVKSLRAE